MILAMILVRARLSPQVATIQSSIELLVSS
jgi:hypothetical protein